MRGIVGEEGRGKETDGCPLTDRLNSVSYIICGMPEGLVSCDLFGPEGGVHTVSSLLSSLSHTFSLTSR
jgi:hypothetical protein